MTTTAPPPNQPNDKKNEELLSPSTTLNPSSSLNSCRGNSKNDITKKHRRYIKKVLKNANKIKRGFQLSGITSKDDWVKLKTFQQQQQISQEEEEEGNQYQEQRCENNKKHNNSSDNNSSNNHNFIFPRILIREKNYRNNEEYLEKRIVDGEDHRDIVQYLFQQQYDKKKDKEQQQNEDSKKMGKTAEEERDDSIEKITTNQILSTPNIPNWVTLHNPALVEHVAIIEIHLEEEKKIVKHHNTEENICNTKENDDNNDNIQISEADTVAISTQYSLSEETYWKEIVSQIFPNDDIDDNRHDITNNDNKSNILKIHNTRWFQGPNPRSITDAMLYRNYKDNEKKKKKKKEQDEKSVHNIEKDFCKLGTLVKKLNDFFLTFEQQEQEGYPMLPKENTEYNKIEKNEQCEMQIQKEKEKGIERKK